MKLRLHSNTLRLRLSQSEVSALAATGSLEETMSFAPGQTLSYALESTPTGMPAVAFEDNRIRVMLPASTVKNWIESDQTGIDATSGPLRLLVEKDFQCLHRASEEDRDAFPNPDSSQLPG